MAEFKTKQNEQSVAEFLDGIAVIPTDRCYFEPRFGLPREPAGAESRPFEFGCDSACDKDSNTDLAHVEVSSVFSPATMSS